MYECIALMEVWLSDRNTFKLNVKAGSVSKLFESAKNKITK